MKLWPRVWCLDFLTHGVLLLHPFNGLFTKIWVSRYQKGKISLYLNEARDDGVWDGSSISCMDHANNLHLAADR